MRFRSPSFMSHLRAVSSRWVAISYGGRTARVISFDCVRFALGADDPDQPQPEQQRDERSPHLLGARALFVDASVHDDTSFRNRSEAESGVGRALRLRATPCSPYTPQRLVVPTKQARESRRFAARETTFAAAAHRRCSSAARPGGSCRGSRVLR